MNKPPVILAIEALSGFKGSITPYAYLLDIEDIRSTAGANEAVNASNTYGFRFDLAREVGPGKASFIASYADQSDTGDNPLDYNADYMWLEGTYGISKYSVKLGYEVLAGDGTRGFQTPLSTAHKFQGWADRFLTTPANGIEDMYFNLGTNFGDVSVLKGLKVNAIYHNFESENTSEDLGEEFNAIATAKYKDFGLLLKYANFGGADELADKQVFWASIEVGL